MIKDIHSYWAYLVLIVLIFTVINSIIGFVKKKQFTHKDLRLGLFTLIASHIQFLIGLSLYFISPWYKALTTNGSEVVKDRNARLLALEHPLTMLIAIVLITIGWSKHKKQQSDSAKFKTFAIFYSAALILILLRIPWNNWF